MWIIEFFNEVLMEWEEKAVELKTWKTSHKLFFFFSIVVMKKPWSKCQTVKKKIKKKNQKNQTNIYEKRKSFINNEHLMSKQRLDLKRRIIVQYCARFQ